MINLLRYFKQNNVSKTTSAEVKITSQDKVYAAHSIAQAIRLGDTKLAEKLKTKYF